MCALIDPGTDQFAFLLSHLGDVAQWHDRRGDGLRLDARGLLLNLFWRIEHHSRRRNAEQLTGRRGRMAHRATMLNHFMHFGEVRAGTGRLGLDRAR